MVNIRFNFLVVGRHLIDPNIKETETNFLTNLLGNNHNHGRFIEKRRVSSMFPFVHGPTTFNEFGDRIMQRGFVPKNRRAKEHEDEMEQDNKSKDLNRFVPSVSVGELSGTYVINQNPHSI